MLRETMKKTSAIKVLAVIVGISGVLVMIGWIFDIGFLKSILPIWVTMKFSTALSFFLSGITLFFITRSVEKATTYASVILAGAMSVIFLLMATLLISNITGTSTGFEDLFVEESEGAVKTTVPGRPSVGTMINFILVAVSGYITLFDPQQLKLKLSIIGRIIAVIGGIALIGYFINTPILYYTIEGWSTAMAIHTAILFVILGVGFALLFKADHGKGLNH